MLLPPVMFLKASKHVRSRSARSGPGLRIESGTRRLKDSADHGISRRRRLQAFDAARCTSGAVGALAEICHRSPLAHANSLKTRATRPARRGLHRARRMLACLRTAAVFGVEACPVHVEVDVVVRLPVLHDGRPAGRQRPREPRPRAQRDPQFRLRVSAAPHHRQSGAGRCAQGRRVVRPADRARHPRRAGHRRAPA